MREGLVVLLTQAEERSCKWLQLGLARKLNSNSLASWSKDEIEKGFNQLHHIHAGPRRVLREARHIRALDMLYRAILARKISSNQQLTWRNWARNEYEELDDKVFGSGWPVGAGGASEVSCSSRGRLAPYGSLFDKQLS
ncbi:hypothetical protein BHE74_00056022 [Ensete ventricosum]|nr:hypothetical protein BHE74_00056022 [Ensete ventricosum]